MPIPARSARTWVWQIDPAELGLPNRPGPHTLVGHYGPGLADTLTFEAPVYLGGVLDYRTVPGTELEALRPLMDSLRAEPVYTYGDVREGYWGRWRTAGVHLDSAVARYSSDPRFAYVEADRTVQVERSFVTSGESGPAAADVRTAAYPNPAHEYVLLHVGTAALERAEIDVYDGLGRLVLRAPEQTVTAATPARVDVSALPAGVYVFRVRGGRVERSGRFTVAR